MSEIQIRGNVIDRIHKTYLDAVLARNDVLATSLEEAQNRAERAESSLAAMRQRAEEAEKERDKFKRWVGERETAIRCHQSVLSETDARLDAAIARAEQAENVLHYIADQCDKGMAGNWAVNQARIYFATTSTADASETDGGKKPAPYIPEPWGGPDGEE